MRAKRDRATRPLRILLAEWLQFENPFIKNAENMQAIKVN
jgi:hypothetical protein